MERNGGRRIIRAILGVPLWKRWVARRRRARACDCHLPRSIGCDDVVVLIHGTFGRHAEWTGHRSEFREALRTSIPPHDCRVFCWSGQNSQQARLVASRELRDLIHQEIAENPFVRVHLVAHSHGGNVALLAVDDVTSPYIHGIATLATPFLHFSNTHHRAPSFVTAIVLTVAVWWLVFVNGEPGVSFYDGLIGLLLGSLLVASLATAFFGFRTARFVFRHRDERSEHPSTGLASYRLDGLNPPGSSTDIEMLAVVPGADEASAGLLAAQLGANVGLPMQRLAAYGALGAIPIAIGLGLLFLVLIFLAIVIIGITVANEVATFDEWYLRMEAELSTVRGEDIELSLTQLGQFVAQVTLLVGVVGLSIFLVRLIALATAGSDVPALATVRRPVVTTTPLGRVVAAVAVDTSRSGEGLHHSRIHGSAQIGQLVGSWLARRHSSTNRRDNEPPNSA